MSSRDQETASPSQFAELGLDQHLVQACARARLEAPTDLQRNMIPAVLAGRDCLAIARSGAGKTNAYILPICQTLTRQAGLQAVVIQPTRATARIIQRAFQRFVHRRTPVELLADTHSRLRNPNPSVLISTPHAAERLLRRRPARWWSSLRTVVIDELDTLIEVGACEPTESFLRGLQPRPQLIFVAGHVDETVQRLADEFLNDPARFEAAPISPAVDRLRCFYQRIDPARRFEALCALLRRGQPRLALVFTTGPEQAQALARRLNEANIPARWIEERRRRPRDRRARPAMQVTVADDPPRAVVRTVPATFVVHYDLPEQDDTYARRMDHCDRVRRPSPCYTLAAPDECERVERLAQQIGIALNRQDAPATVETVSHGDPQRGSAAPAASDDGNTDPAADPSRPQPLPKTLGSRFPVRRSKRLIPRWKNSRLRPRW